MSSLPQGFLLGVLNPEFQKADCDRDPDTTFDREPGTLKRKTPLELQGEFFFSRVTEAPD
jgi:hypothetical protein